MALEQLKEQEAIPLEENPHSNRESLSTLEAPIRSMMGKLRELHGENRLFPEVTVKIADFLNDTYNDLEKTLLVKTGVKPGPEERHLKIAEKQPKGLVKESKENLPLNKQVLIGFEKDIKSLVDGFSELFREEKLSAEFVTKITDQIHAMHRVLEDNLLKNEEAVNAAEDFESLMEAIKDHSIHIMSSDGHSFTPEELIGLVEGFRCGQYDDFHRLPRGQGWEYTFRDKVKELAAKNSSEK